MLFVFFSLIAFNILSLFSVLVVLMIVCHGEVLFWSTLFSVLGEMNKQTQTNKKQNKQTDKQNKFQVQEQ
jgi:hypothetical protein